MKPVSRTWRVLLDLGGGRGQSGNFRSPLPCTCRTSSGWWGAENLHARSGDGDRVKTGSLPRCPWCGGGGGGHLV